MRTNSIFFILLITVSSLQATAWQGTGRGGEGGGSGGSSLQGYASGVINAGSAKDVDKLNRLFKNGVVAITLMNGDTGTTRGFALDSGCLNLIKSTVSTYQSLEWHLTSVKTEAVECAEHLDGNCRQMRIQLSFKYNHSDETDEKTFDSATRTCSFSKPD